MNHNVFMKTFLKPRPEALFSPEEKLLRKEKRVSGKTEKETLIQLNKENISYESRHKVTSAAVLSRAHLL